MKKCLAQPLPSRGGVCNFIMPNYHLTHNIMYARAHTGLSENNLHLHTLPRNALPAGFSGLCSPTRTFTEPSPVLHRGAPGRKRSPFFRQWGPPWRIGGGSVKVQGVPEVCNRLISNRIIPPREGEGSFSKIPEAISVPIWSAMSLAYGLLGRKSIINHNLFCRYRVF